MNGRIVYAVKAALLTENPSQITKFVGFPTKRTILAVFAAANSDINQDVGLSWTMMSSPVNILIVVRYLRNCCIVNQKYRP